MTTQRFFTSLRSFAYFAGLPWINYVLNAWYRHRFSKRFMPRVLYIETTNHCNAHCVMCPHDKLTRPRGVMPWVIFMKIIDDCVSFEGRGLEIFLHKDGEPLMDPQLFERIAYVKRTLTRSHVHFNTNASLMTDDKIERILDSELDSITFSVDGASESTYSQIRVGLDYEKVKANVERFLAQKAARGSRLHVTLQMVLSRENAHEADAYRRLWEGRVDRVFVKPMHNFLVQKTAYKGGEVGSVQLARCGMPFHVMLFYSNGDAGLCCWDYDEIMKLGNVMDSSVLDLFNNEQYGKVRMAMKAMKCGDIRPCNICSQIYGHDGRVWRDWTPDDG